MNAPGAAPAMRGAFSGFTRLSKGIAAVLVAGYVCTALVPQTREFVALVPVRTIPFGWNLITAGVLETSLINVVVNVPALLLLGKLLEPIWGSKEFLKFILVVSTGTSLLTWVLMICLYYITQKEHFLYDKISGFHGVVAGFLVALKQLMPDQELSAVSVIKFRARWLSPIVVLLSITLCVVFGDPHAVLPFVIFGTYTSWLYLRFFQTKPEGNLKGDPSEEFSFASFFPDLLRPLVGGVAWVFYRLFCSRAEASPTDANTGYILGGKPLPGSDPVDASRRRERGARALEERLNAVKAAQAAEAGNVANLEESSDAAAPSSGLPISNKPGVAARHEATTAADNSV